MAKIVFNVFFMTDAIHHLSFPVIFAEINEKA